MNTEEFDLIIIGGGISSSLLTLNILNARPESRIAIIEKSVEFPQKIGESTTDIGSFCLKSFGITHLLDKHQDKAGLRFLFNENNSFDEGAMAEFSSPSYKARTNGFHLDRKVFDEDLIKEVESKGAIIFRPAEVVESSHGEFSNSVTISHEGQSKVLTARWCADATGRARYLHNKLGWKDIDLDLNTGAIMAHFKGIAPNTEWDMPESNHWKESAISERRFATIHFMRKHAWWWMIRLDDETTSIGCVFDNEHYSIEDASKQFDDWIADDAQLSEVCKKASRSEVKHLKKLPYASEQFHSKGQLLIGDSAAFVDPFLSPGLEYICQTVIWTSEILVKEFETKNYQESAWKKFERKFRKSYKDRALYHKVGYAFSKYYDLFGTWIRLANFAYVTLYVNPAMLFDRRKRIPGTMKWFERIGFKFLSWRLKRITKIRERKNYVPKRRKFKTSFSGFQIAKGLMWMLVPIKLFWKFIITYIGVEIRHIGTLFR